MGFASGKIYAMLLGYSLNFQTGHNLFTFRSFNYRKNYFTSDNLNEPVSDIIPFSTYAKSSYLNEYALPYGQRFVFDNSSLSAFLGISTNQAVYRVKIGRNRIRTNLSFFGLPNEINYKFFESEKSRFRAPYVLAPLGKPTGFARSFGIKLHGNVGKESYIGLGITFGLGWHKQC